MRDEIKVLWEMRPIIQGPTQKVQFQFWVWHPCEEESNQVDREEYNFGTRMKVKEFQIQCR